VSTLVKRVIPGRCSEAEASPQSILPDLWLLIPDSRPVAEPPNDGTEFFPNMLVGSRWQITLNYSFEQVNQPSFPLFSAAEKKIFPSVSSFPI